MGSTPRVLFACVHNAGRSQMAAALLRVYAGDAVEVLSAGSEPAGKVNPEVVLAMAERHIDLAEQAPRLLTTEAVRRSDVVVTMGCGDTCPFFPGKRYLDWDLADPAGKSLAEIRPIRDEIDRRVRNLLAELVPDSAPSSPAPGELREQVRARYAAAAVGARGGEPTACCDSSCCPSSDSTEGFGASLYSDADRAGLPSAAIRASLGCGNPTAVAELHQGETVLDLGSGGGIDVLLSAKRVGLGGHVYGLDMTDEMLELARSNAREAGAANVEFLKGEIESIPLPDETVDVVISNCVINLSVDKDRVLREVFRVLRPGGRLAVSDIVVRGSIPAELSDSVPLWAACLAGAMEETEYRSRLVAAGFTDVDMRPTRVFDGDEARVFLTDQGADAATIAPLVAGQVMSAIVRAKKPA